MAERKDIMESAIQLFKEKGYTATSVQDIATDCRISKGSFYKLFTSKKDLYLNVMLYLHDSTLETCELIDTSRLAPKDKLIQKTKAMIENSFSNRKIYQSFPEVLPPEEVYKLIKEIRTHKIKIYQIYKDNLLKVYNQPENIWDLVLIYGGLITEYIDLISFNTSAVNFERAAVMMVQCLDSYIENEHTSISLLNKEVMKDFEWTEPSKTVKTYSKKEMIENSIKEIKKLIGKQRFSAEEESIYLSNVDLLQEELKSENPRSYLITSLTYFLSQKRELKEAAYLLMDKYNLYGERVSL